jgi:hypothetical protein
MHATAMLYHVQQARVWVERLFCKNLNIVTGLILSVNSFGEDRYALEPNSLSN